MLQIEVSQIEVSQIEVLQIAVLPLAVLPLADSPVAVAAELPDSLQALLAALLPRQAAVYCPEPYWSAQAELAAALCLESVGLKVAVPQAADCFAGPAQAE